MRKRVWATGGIAGILFACVAHAGPSAETAPAVETASPSGPERMDGRVYEILVMEPGKADRVDRMLFRRDALDSYQFRKLGYAPGVCAFEDGIEGWTLKAEMTSAPGGHALWQANVQEEGIEGTVEWKRPDGTRATLTYSGTLLPPLYQRLGGAGVIGAIVDDFVARVTQDPLVNADKEMAALWAAPDLKARLTTRLCLAAGGPAADVSEGGTMATAGPIPPQNGAMPREVPWSAVAADLRHALTAQRVAETEQDEFLVLARGVLGELSKP